MKKFILLSLYALLFTINLSAQQASTDRFIRIVGNAKEVIKASEVTFDIILTEVAPNEYRQVRFKGIDQIYQELITKLKFIGIQETQLKKDIIKSFSGYDNVRNVHYNLTVPTTTDLSQLAELGVEGCKINNLQYVFSEEINDSDELKLSGNAIEDAKRKASKIASSIGKKVGKILNIDSINRSNSRADYGLKQDAKTVNFTINITFELVD